MILLFIDILILIFVLYVISILYWASSTNDINKKPIHIKFAKFLVTKVSQILKKIKK